MRGSRNGLFMIGVGPGLFFGYLMDMNMPLNGSGRCMGDPPSSHFTLVLLFRGIALVTYHLVVRRKRGSSGTRTGVEAGP